MNLDYKGFTGTRVVLTILCLAISVIMHISGTATSAEVLDFMFKVLTAYGLSEVGAKGATAYKERGGLGNQP